MSSVTSISEKSFFIVSLGALFYFYEYYLRICPSVMKHDWVNAFHINATKFGTLSAFYYYAYVPMQLVVGLFVDRFKMRHILTFAILACVAGSLMIASTDSYMVAAMGRFLQGFGSAFAFVGALKLAATWLPASRFGLFSCSCAALGFFGAALGEISLAHAVSTIGWRQAIVAFSLFGVLLMLVVWFALNLKPDESIFSNNENKQNPEDNSTNNSTNNSSDELNQTTHTFKQLLAQLLIIAKTPYVWMAGIISSLMYLPTSAFAELWGIPYLEKFHQYSPEAASWASAMIFIGWGCGAPIQGFISDYFQNRIKVILFGCILGTALSTVVLFDANLSYFSVCTILFLFGLVSSAQVLTFAMVKDVVSNKTVGTAIAFVNALTMFTGMFMQSGIGKLLDLNWEGVMRHHHRFYSIINYQKAMIVIPTCLMISCVIIFIIRNKKPQALT